MPNTPPLPIAQSALLVIDVQESFTVLPRWEHRNNPSFERNVDRLIQSYRAANLPVVFILHEEGEGAFSGPHVKPMDFIARREDEPVFVKTTRNSFTSTDLESYLGSRGIRRLVITGIQTEQCCETTTRVAGDLGYDVDFVTEATLTFPISHDGDTLTPDEITRNTEFVLRDRFARIRRVEEIVAELEPTAVACAT